MYSSVKRISIAISFILLFFLSSCTLYEYMGENESGITFGYSELKKDCFVGGISYSEGRTTKIVIPNKFNGAPVVKLGGYTGTGLPSPFLVYCDEFYFSEQDGTVYSCDEADLKASIDENTVTNIENVLFCIQLPEELKEISNTELTCVQYAEKFDGEIRILKIFRPVYYFEISENNDTFYTIDGKLYYKASGDLFSDCIYEESDYSKE